VEIDVTKEEMEMIIGALETTAREKNKAECMDLACRLAGLEK